MAMPRFRRVLVAVDGSAHAQLALEAATAIAERDHAQLALVTVAPDVLHDGRMALAGADPQRLQRQTDDAAARVLREAVAALPEDLPVTTQLRHGRPGPEIVDAAADLDADLIVVGARGVGRVGALTGSVSGHVLHHSDRAVFVAHAARDDAGA